MPLRDYQVTAVRETYAALREFDRVLLQMPTGSGKPHVAKAIIEHGLKHHKRINFIVDRITLVDQTFESFMDQGIRAGVVQANHPAFNAALPVQICSIQTLKRKRSNDWPIADLMIVDEAHDQHQAMYAQMEKWNALKYLGLSATPFTTGLGLHWQKLVVGSTTSELMRRGFLSPYVAFGPSTPDLQGVGSMAGDFSKKEMEPRVKAIIGSVVDHYVENAEGRKALVFAVNVAHAKELALEFIRRGIDADYVEGRDTPERRSRVLKDFRSGLLDVVVNCEVLTKGFDLPDITCLILARPTRSLSLHIQMLGRGLRTAKGKVNCLILDHAGNIERLGYPDDPLPQELCTKEKGVSSKDKREKDEPKPWNCSKCHHLNPHDTLTCTCCGYMRKKPSKVVEKSGKLVELAGAGKRADKQCAYSMLLCHAEGHGYSSGWVAHKYKKLFGVWPRQMSETLETPTPEFRSWLKSEQIRYAKQRKS